MTFTHVPISVYRPFDVGRDVVYNLRALFTGTLPHGPDIGLLVVRQTLAHLRRQVVRRADHRAVPP